MKKILLIVLSNILIFFVLCFAFNSFLKIGMNSYFSLADILRARYQNNSVVEKIISGLDKILGCYDVEGETYEYADDEVEPVTIKQIPITPKLAEEYCGHDRLRYNIDSSRNPIVTLGGSYVYGHGLKEEKTFPYLLSKLSNRPVYNLSVCGGEIVGSLSFNYNNKISSEEIKNADYYVYIYMFDHLNRYLSNYVLMKHYTELFKTGKVEHALAQITMFRYFFCFYRRAKILKSVKNQREFLKTVMLWANNKIKKISPDAKFIIVIYDEKVAQNAVNADVRFLKDGVWDEISKETGCTIVHTKDLLGFKFDKDYKIPIDFAPGHPNSKAWAVFTPKFEQKYIINL